MIPKIIHYCWFGGNEMPKDQKKYIDGWKKLLPDYKFKCWNENDFNIDGCQFTKDARNAGKWAFVADYVRLYALFTIGGVYMDTDVKLFKSFNSYLNCSFFSSFENHLNGESQFIDQDGNRLDCSKIKIPEMGIMSAVIGAEKGSVFIKDVLDFYNSHSFDYIFSNRLTIPTTLSYCAEKYGFKYIDKYQILDAGIVIYPTTVFSNYDQQNKESVTVHFCAGSWSDKSLYKKIRGRLYRIKWLRNIVKSIKYKA